MVYEYSKPRQIPLFEEDYDENNEMKLIPYKK